MLRSRVASAVAELDLLREEGFWWLPGTATVRPSPETLARKIEHAERVRAFYRTELDFVLEEVFHLRTEFDEDGKLFVVEGGAESGPERVKKFLPNAFPYDLPPGAHHAIMWYLGAERGELTDEAITTDVAAGVAARHAAGPTDAVDFAWYVNPKMSVPGTFHVQVFFTVSRAAPPPPLPPSYVAAAAVAVANEPAS